MAAPPAALAAPLPQNSEEAKQPVAQPEDAPTPQGKGDKRKLKRWGSEDHVARVMKEKLAGYDPLEVCSAVGKTTGTSPKEYIMDHIRQNKRSHEVNLASSFWVSFFRRV